MVKSRTTAGRQASLDATFAALADPTRRAMLGALARGERTIGELAQPFAMSLPAASKHVHVLERAGLARVRRDGRVRRCQLIAAPLSTAARWIEWYRRFWDGQLDQLARYLGEQPIQQEEGSAWLSPPPRLPRPTRSRSAAPSPRRRSGSSARGRRRKS